MSLTAHLIQPIVIIMIKIDMKLRIKTIGIHCIENYMHTLTPTYACVHTHSHTHTTLANNKLLVVEFTSG